MAFYQREGHTETVFFCCNGHGPWRHPFYDICMEPDCNHAPCDNCTWQNICVKDDSIGTQNQYQTGQRTGTVFPQTASSTIMSQQYIRTENSASSQSYYSATGPMNGAVVMSDNVAIDNSKGVHVFNPSSNTPPASSQRQMQPKTQTKSRVSKTPSYSRKSGNASIFSAPVNHDHWVRNCCQCGGNNDLYTGEDSHHVICQTCGHIFNDECCGSEFVKT